MKHVHNIPELKISCQESEDLAQQINALHLRKLPLWENVRIVIRIQDHTMMLRNADMTYVKPLKRLLKMEHAKHVHNILAAIGITVGMGEHVELMNVLRTKLSFPMVSAKVVDQTSVLVKMEKNA